MRKVNRRHFVRGVGLVGAGLARVWRWTASRRWTRFTRERASRKRRPPQTPTRRSSSASTARALPACAARATHPIVLQPDLSGVRFALESDRPSAHAASVRLAGLTPGRYAVHSGDKPLPDIEIFADRETALLLPMAAGAPPPPVYAVTRLTRKTTRS